MLVYNSGIARDNLLMWMTKDEWNSVISTNLNGFFNVTRQVVFAMLKARRGRDRGDLLRWPGGATRPGELLPPGLPHLAGSGRRSSRPPALGLAYGRHHTWQVTFRAIGNHRIPLVFWSSHISRLSQAAPKCLPTHQETHAQTLGLGTACLFA